eukprot:TRINITY_DN10280_c0_g1_i2.p1 TRINITY_DN10280_c0_g1~~TRINITY_DN10280_c0_g1_i2.p1  ORF type:complete len:1572 (+),score=490.45 TRINITY_DN10280_c0_g1_i2:138-4853(+)
MASKGVHLLVTCVYCCLTLVAQGASFSSVSVGHRDAPAATAIGKVTQLLQEMKARSEQLQRDADTEFAAAEEACGTEQTAKEGEISQLELDAESLQARVSELTVTVERLSQEIQQHESDVMNASSRLDEARRLRAEQHEVATHDIAEYGSAIGALDHALAALQHSQNNAKLALLGGSRVQRHASLAPGGPSPPALRGGSSSAAPESVRSSLALAAAGVRRLRSRGLYTPDDGGFAKDAHLFDEFQGLSTAVGAYVAQSSSVEDLLSNLKTKFRDERSKLVDAERSRRVSFESEELSLEAQMKSGRDGATTKREELATARSELLDAGQNSKDTTMNLESTKAYVSRLKSACDDKRTAYESLRNMRVAEAEALDRAIAVMTGDVAVQAAKHLPSLIRLHRATLLGGSSRLATRSLPFPAVATKSADHDGEREGEKNVVGFLRSKAAKLSSISLGRLATTLDAVVAVQDDADPLAKVKTMIHELVVQLQQTAAQEATQKAWCDTELQRNEATRKGAEADIDKHGAAIKQYEGDANELELQVGDLNATLSSSVAMREELVNNRSAESAGHQTTITECDESAQAVGAAILVLEDFFKNATATAKKAAEAAAAAKKNSTGLPGAVAQSPSTSVAAPLTAEGGNVVAMLEVVRSDFDRLARETREREAEAERTHQQVLTDHDVMVARAETDRNNKMQELYRLRESLATSQADLTDASAALADASTAYENLKPPCLNAETYEERQQKRDAEIAALRDAVSMLDDLAAQLGLAGVGAAALVQQPPGNASAADAPRLNGTGASSSLLAHQTASGQEPAANAEASGEQPLDTVVQFLQEIRSDVAAELADDTKVHTDMQSWCENAIRLKQAAIADAEQREADLRTEIETSAREKEILATQIEQHQKDLAKHQGSLDQSSELRAREAEAFHANEKELLTSIQALKSALTVLSRHYAANETSPSGDFAAERAALEAQRDEGTAAAAGGSGLVATATAVRRALGVIPGGEAGLLAAISVQDGESLKAFLAAGSDEVSARHGRTALVSRAVAAAAVDGGVVFGILKQLLTTFKADLEAARTKEAADAESFKQLTETKRLEVEALQASIMAKQEQLAHYTAANAAAKEDLVFNQEARKADVEYLMDVQQQCRDTAHEFNLRNATRTEELQALNEAIEILVAEQAFGSPAATVTFTAARAEPAVPSAMSVTHHVFRRSTDGAGNKSAGKVFGSDVITGETKRKAFNVARVANTSTASVSFAAAATRLSSLTAPASNTLAALAMHVEVGLARLQRARVGPNTAGALQQVIDSIDSLSTTLVGEKKMETRMRDTCVGERNAASEQLERRLSDEARLNNSIIRLDAQVNKTTDQIGHAREQIEALNTSLAEAAARRESEHAGFGAAVQKQQAHQVKLSQAIQKLKGFYGKKSATALVQRRHSAEPAEPAAPLAERERSRVNRSSYEVQPPSQGSFSKPLSHHEGALGDASAELQQAGADREQCRTEMGEIRDFLAIVEAKCGFLLAHYAESQEARATELDNLRQARELLKGMIKEPSVTPASGLLQILDAARNTARRVAGPAAASPSAFTS